MLDLLLARENELVEARAPVWWKTGPETTLWLLVGLGALTAAWTGVAIVRWARATSGLQRAAVLAIGAGVALVFALVALLASTFPPLVLAPSALLLLHALTVRARRRRDARVAGYPPVQAVAACSG